ncbi:MAG: hypothetical protein U1F77_06415 [Kiritimatiellia bacterium]
MSNTACVWGVDLSGLLQGAGGVGELLALRDAGNWPSTTTTSTATSSE